MFKTIARRIASSYIVILLALVIITGVTIRHAIEAREISDRVINVRVPTVEHETELAFAIRDSRTALNRWIVLREQEPLDTHAQAWSKIDEELNKLRSLSDSWLTEARRQKLSAIERELGTLRSKQASLKEHVSTSGTFDETARAQDAEVATAATNVLSLLEELREEQHLVLAADLRFSDSQSEQLLITIIVLLVVSVVGATILGTVTTRSIVRPVNRSVTLADEIASGRFEGEIAVHGVRELERLAASMDTMRRNLKTLTEDLKKQNERKTQLANFNNTLRGEQTPEKLSENVLSFLAPLYDIQIAAFFLGYDDKTYHLVASYGYTKRKNLSNVFSLAEGLVGQAAYERKPITITKAPEDYIVVRSGLGEAAPRNIMVVPVQFEGRVLGVMEFGSLHDFDEGFGEIIKESIENVGIAIYSALARKRMRELLEQTQTQAEELQTQQEELRTANEELEEQARRLQQSEEELRTQSEELRATNEELEEKTKYLEQQKQRIEDKNTEVESARRNIERKAQELAVASKYKSEFLANMSHELRTPLNSLLILAKSLAENEGGNLTPEQIESAKIIHSGGHDLLNLINDILDLSKVEAGKLDVQFESIEAESIGKALRRQFDPVAKERNLAFDIKIEDDLSLVTDRHRLTQILKNLLSNAFKFTSKGGVTLNIATARELPKQFSGRWDGEAVIAFSVTDTGVGIPEDKQHVIFEAFQQADGSTSRKYGGTGLGLTISRELARLLGGELHLVSKEDQGSTFTCFLPQRNSTTTGATINTAEATHEAASSEGKPEQSETSISVQLATISATEDDREALTKDSKAVLIIEDDRAFAQILADLARKKDFQCLIAHDGKDGLDLAERYRPSAIILDIGLPDIDGRTVLEHLKFNLSTRHIPVHVVSGISQDNHVLNIGAMGFLRKPVEKVQLEQMFDKFEEMLASTIKHILLIEDDETTRKAVTSMIGSKAVKIIATASGKEGLDILSTKHIDCVILDLMLPDISGFDWLREAKNLVESLPPIVVYTGRELSRDEHRQLGEYASSIIVKSALSLERLLDETTLFLHSVESQLPEKQRKIIEALHNPEKLLQGRRILLVDDDTRNIFALSGILRKQGMDVIMADNGELALQVLGREKDIEIILMDIMMPVMDGYETMKRIRALEKFQSLPIIALTAKAMKEDRAKCLAAGANDYLTKPVDVEKLLTLLRVWLSKGREA